MNPLGELVRTRSDQLQQAGVSIRAQAQRGGFPNPRTLHYWRARTEPGEQLPRQDVLDRLAAALDLPEQRVFAAAVLSLLPEHPTDLQRLLRTQQAKLGLRHLELAERAGITEYTLLRILGSDYAELADATVEGLARAFEVSPRRVVQAAAQRVDYRLPAYLASRMSEDMWERILRVIEAMLEEG